MNHSSYETNEDLKQAKRQYTIVGLGLFVIVLTMLLLQFLETFIVLRIYPQGNVPFWLIWLLSFLPIYLVVVPIGLVILRKAPVCPPEQHDLKPGRVVAAAFIAIFMIYAGNILGNFVQALLQTATGLQSLNAVEELAMDDSLFFSILFMGILAPIVEEYIFRKQFIDHTGMYGGKAAVIASAVSFGLFHGNLPQFFYTSILGLLLGYIYLKTGKLRYTIGLHVMVNLIGGVLMPMVSRRSMQFGPIDLTDAAAVQAAVPYLLPVLLFSFVLIVFVIIGLVLFCINIRKVHFCASEHDMPKGRVFQTVCLNVGAILFVVISLVTFVISFMS